MEYFRKLISYLIHLDLKYIEEEKQDNRYLSRTYDSLEGNIVDKDMEDQIVEFKIEDDSSENGLHYLTDSRKSSKETNNRDIEIIYSFLWEEKLSNFKEESKLHE